MTENDYLYYKMNKNEMDKWEELSSDVKTSFYSLVDITGIPKQVFDNVLDRITKAREPWYGAKGYINNSGFYCVEENDRGKVTLIYSGYTYESSGENMDI